MKPILSSRAERDVAEIALYTLDRWGVDQTDSYIAGLNELIEQLAVTRGRGQDIAGVRKAIRRAKFKAHFIFFEHRGDILYVLRILHEQMDLVAHLR